MNSLRRSVFSRLDACLGFALAALLLHMQAKADPVTDWIISQGTPVTSGLNTSSPTIGDGSPENADAVGLYANFPAITLGESGVSVVLSGSLTLSGITSTDAGTNQQLRFGLFDNLGSAGTSGWLGYFTANSTSANAGVIRQRNANNPDLYISNTGSAIVASTANPPNSKTGAVLANDTYSFSLQITRDGGNYDIMGSLSGGPGGNFLDSFSISDLVPASTETFTFNTAGFLIGGAMNADQVQFNNVDVTFVPEPGSITLCGLGAILASRRRRSTLVAA